MANRPGGPAVLYLSALILSTLLVAACAGSGSSGGGQGGGLQQGTPPGAPTGLTATAGNQQVSLSWTASSGATSYHLKRATSVHHRCEGGGQRTPGDHGDAALGWCKARRRQELQATGIGASQKLNILTSAASIPTTATPGTVWLRAPAAAIRQPTSPRVRRPEPGLFSMLDDSTQTCPSGTTCYYRKDWATALASAFGSGTCTLPYFQIGSCHFYDMDKEIAIWGGTHRDVHPNPSGYDELVATYFTEATNLKTWDPEAVRLGPVSCCWWFYWNGAHSSDKGAHAGVDFLPWWLNQIYWNDQIAGTRSLDVFDIHAYPDGPDMTGYTLAEKQAAATSIYRDYWDPTFVSPSSTINQPYTTSMQPNKTIPFRIPRMRAMVNSIYPGTPLAFTEWSADFASPANAPDTDYSTALGDVDGYGLLGRERVSLASRWTAPQSTNPNYQALKLFTNYDGSHHGFGTTSVEATHNTDPDLFSVYAALNSGGTALTIMVVNKDPANAAQVTFTTTGFNPSGTESTYTLSEGSPTAIASAVGSWSATETFPPYTATLLVVPGSLANAPASDWDLNPATIMVPASGTATLNPILTTGTTNVTLSSAVFDSFEGATACTGGTITLTTSTITTTTNAEITVNAPSTAGFCHFTVTGSDGVVTQTQGGWIVVGNPAATLPITGGNNQTGGVGTSVPQALAITLNPGSSGGSITGASVLFTASRGSLSKGTTSGTKVIAVTNSSGVASVTLTYRGARAP